MDDHPFSQVLKRINRLTGMINSFNQAAVQTEVKAPESAPTPEPAPNQGQVAITVPPEMMFVPVKKRYKRATKDISRKNIATSAEDILKVYGIGFIKEIIIVADNKINLILILDDKELLVDRNTWDDLVAITTYSNTITARVVGSSFVLILSNVYFKKSFDMRVYFSVAANIQSILGFYDICEAWQK